MVLEKIEKNTINILVINAHRRTEFLKGGGGLSVVHVQASTLDVGSDITIQL